MIEMEQDMEDIDDAPKEGEDEIAKAFYRNAFWEAMGGR